MGWNFGTTIFYGIAVLALLSGAFFSYKSERKQAGMTWIALLLILVCGAGGLFYMLRGGIGSEPVMAYSTDREFQHQKISGISQRADAFAANGFLLSP